MEERHDGSGHCLTVPSSMNVMSECFIIEWKRKKIHKCIDGSSMTSTSSLIMIKEEPNVFLEIPSSTGMFINH